MNLKAIRKARGYKQQDVAKAIGVSVPAYSQYEAGKREPDVEKIKSLSKFLDVSADELIGNPYSKEKTMLDLTGYTIAQIDEIRQFAEFVKVRGSK